MKPITVNGNTIDPDSAPAGIAPIEPQDASESNYILIQTTAGSLSQEQKAVLQENSVAILEYVSEDTYLCGYKPTDLNAIRSLDFVGYTAVYPPGLVVQADLKAAAITTPVHVRLHDDVEITDDFKSRLANAVHLDVGEIAFYDGEAYLTAPSDGLSEVASLDEVKSIQVTGKPRLFNNVARQILKANVTVNNIPFKGKGEIVAVADTGFDTGRLDKHHFAFMDPEAVTKSRVKKLYALGRKSSHKSDDPDGHGTHVCGSVLGSGDSPLNGGLIEGPASQAQLIMQSLLSGEDGDLGGIPPVLYKLFEAPYNDGARIHTNSWGSGPSEQMEKKGITQLPYDPSSTSIDKFVSDHPDMVILFAAGNDGKDKQADGLIDMKYIGSEAAAKNCISVGASENLRPNVKFPAQMQSYTWGRYWPKDFPVKTAIGKDHMANNIDSIAAFSSRGPTKEGRIKPDIVAPGTAILSTRSSAIPPQVDEDDMGISDDKRWMYLSGTSMATPLVAGCCAVLRQVLRSRGETNPPAALIKALLINGAVGLPGQSPPQNSSVLYPNVEAGYGRVDLSAAAMIAPSDTTTTFGYGSRTASSNAEAVVETITVPQSRQPRTLKVTLAYTDAPGAQLQNDLNLVVRAGTVERHGNKGSVDFPRGAARGTETSPGWDHLNNVEQVVWEEIPAGEVQVVVTAYRLTGSKQDYSYAWRLE